MAAGDIPDWGLNPRAGEKGKTNPDKLPRTEPVYYESMQDIDLQREVLDLYSNMKALLLDSLVDPEVPTNQRAQVANSVRASLDALVKAQTEIYNANRLKKLETILLKVLRTLPVHAQKEFVRRYKEQALGEIEDVDATVLPIE